MKTVIVTSATGEPIVIGDAKSHLRIDSTTEDTLLYDLIVSARYQVEHLTGRKLMPQTWKAYFDEWPSGNKYDHFDIPYPPLRSIPSTGLVYTSSTSGSTTLSSTAWASDIVSEPGRLVLDYNDDWPTETLHNNNPISIEFQCGYLTASKIPEPLILAIKLIVGHAYENRESVTVTAGGVTMQETPQAIKWLLAPYRIFTF